MVIIAVRCIIIYVLLTFAMKITGRRQIGELDVGDLVSTLLISELAAIPSDDPDVPLLNAVIPILIIVSLEIIISALKNRWRPLKKAVEGRPVYIIYKGRLLEETLVNNRISINELLAEMRGAGIFDISEVEYGIIEQNGKLSLFKKTDTAFAHTLIADGEIMTETVKRLKAEGVIKKALKETSAEDIMLLTVDDSGTVNTIRRKKDGS
jgi:uncharacterized membrane protein YcaP (DUF421 family)